LGKQPGFSSLHLQELILPNPAVLERACGDDDDSPSNTGLCSDFYVLKWVPTVVDAEGMEKMLGLLRNGGEQWFFEFLNNPMFATP
jgi:hypothetical protein